MEIAIFSDLHLDISEENPKNQKFLALLDELCAEGISHLCLLGDIYDLFIGPQKFWRTVHRGLFEKLEALRKNGCEIYWVEGNHDFHIEKHLKALGIHVVLEDLRLELEGKKIFMSHGDTVNQEDEKYLKWRATTKSKAFRSLISAVPSFLGEKIFLPIACRASNKSKRERIKGPQPEIDALYVNYAKKLIEKEDFDAVLLGHHHKKCLEKLGKGFYLNVGGWESGKGAYARWTPSNPQPQIIDVSW